MKKLAQKFTQTEVEDVVQLWNSQFSPKIPTNLMEFHPKLPFWQLPGTRQFLLDPWFFFRGRRKKKKTLRVFFFSEGQKREISKSVMAKFFEFPAAASLYQNVLMAEILHHLVNNGINDQPQLV